MLYAKCLITLDRNREARNELLYVKRFILEHVSDTKIDYRKGKDAAKLSIGLLSTKKEYLSFLTDDGISMTKKKVLLEQIRKRSDLFSAMADLFYNMGDWNNCELMYVRYVKLLENNFGEDSYEAGDCYFLVGVFYF